MTAARSCLSCEVLFQIGKSFDSGGLMAWSTSTRLFSPEIDVEASMVCVVVAAAEGGWVIVRGVCDGWVVAARGEGVLGMTGLGWFVGGGWVTAARSCLSCGGTAAEESWRLKRLALLLSRRGTLGIHTSSSRSLCMTLMREVRRCSIRSSRTVEGSLTAAELACKSLVAESTDMKLTSVSRVCSMRSRRSDCGLGLAAAAELVVDAVNAWFRM